MTTCGYMTISHEVWAEVMAGLHPDAEAEQRWDAWETLLVAAPPTWDDELDPAAAMTVTLPGRAYAAAIAETTFEADHGLSAPSVYRRGRGLTYRYDGLSAAQAEALAARLEHLAEVYTGPGSHAADRADGRACRDAAAAIRERLAGADPP